MSNNDFKVAQVIDDYTIVINGGIKDNIKKSDNFLIYALSDEDVLDPDTKKSLGKLEIVRGTGYVDHPQDNMATIISNTRSQIPQPTKRIKRDRSHPFSMFNTPEEEIEIPSNITCFRDVKVGDFARKISTK